MGAVSIRWKLSLTYAGIALLTAAVLGGVLVLVLDTYFARAEDSYLEAVASRASTELVRPGMTLEELERGTAILALTSQVRVQVLDGSGEVVADSGLPDEIDPETLAPPFDGRPERRRLPSPLGGGLFGADGGEDAPRSDRVLRTQLVAQDGVAVGSLVLSEGPATGGAILRSVTQAWALAALAAVALAAGAGYLVSARLAHPIVALTETSDRMADGDLSARAQVDGADEVGRLGASFNAMAERIEATVTTLRRFVADAAHEIGTPLTALQADLELAESSAPQGEQRVFIERALQQARRIEDLSANLLRLSRLEAREGHADETTDLSALVSQAADAFASRAEQAGVAFRVEVADDSLVVEGSAERLHVVLDNLVDNAFKFTPQGGTVGVGARADGAHALLWVSDSGIGIPDAEQPEVFSRFYRARNVSAYPGSGLGLAIVMATVEGYGGTVGLTSGESGTRFDVRLPLA